MPSQRPAVRLLHTSDLHIGDDIDPGGRQSGLRSVVNLSLEHSVDMVLMAGDPGIGKSTILLQTCAHLASQGQRTLYVSGE